MPWKKRLVDDATDTEEDTDELPAAQRATGEVLVKGDSETEIYHLDLPKIAAQLTPDALITILQALTGDQKEGVREGLGIYVEEDWNPTVVKNPVDSTADLTVNSGKFIRIGNLVIMSCIYTTSFNAESVNTTFTITIPDEFSISSTPETIKVDENTEPLDPNIFTRVSSTEIRLRYTLSPTRRPGGNVIYIWIKE